MIYNFDSTMPGALQLSGTAGSLRAILKTYLVDGAGSTAVSSVTVAAGVATVVFASTHPFKIGSVGQFSGATPNALNGQKVISAVVSATSVRFLAPGVADGAATGSITSKLASAGWQELFAGALNILAIKPTIPQATGCILRIDDTGTTNARVRGFESMSDISTGVGAIPLDGQVSGGLYWPKSGAASSAARPWFLTADERGFYLAVSPQGTDRYTLLYAGDIASWKSGDAWSYLVTGNQSDQVAATTVSDGCCGWSHRSARGGAYIARSHLGIGQALQVRRIGSHHNGSSSDSYAGVAGYSWGAFPNPANNGLITGEVELFFNGLRGVLPGLLHPVQEMADSLSSGAQIDGANNFVGRKLLALRVAPPSGSVAPGTAFLDCTGPWGR